MLENVKAVYAVRQDLGPDAAAELDEMGVMKVPVELLQTCELALRRMEEVREGRCARGVGEGESAYTSIDPAPPHTNRNVEWNREVLAGRPGREGEEIPSLYERYRAMFRLREENDVEGLAQVLKTDTSSALLRHEIAFVLGQMQSPGSAEVLKTVLRRCGEHPMVRHEAAEALGAVATASCWDTIKYFANPKHEKCALVRDSCVLALDMYDYYTEWKNTHTASTRVS